MTDHQLLSCPECGKLATEKSIKNNDCCVDDYAEMSRQELIHSAKWWRKQFEDLVVENHRAASPLTEEQACEGCKIDLAHALGETSVLDAEWNVLLGKVKTLAASPSIPEGYCIVPIEPTEEMIAAANAACDTPDADLSWVYKFFIAAAPQPPQSTSAQEGE